MFVSIVLTSLVIAQRSDAVPFVRSGLALRSNANTTAGASDSAWVQTPNVRGTYDLLLSCLTTLSLCAWTAYHPNVNPHHSRVRSFLRRLWWMTVAIFVPEIVLFCAWEQRSTFGVHSTLTKTFHPWTMEQAFFAVSGGLVVDASSFWHQPNLTFTPIGVLELAKAGILPDIASTAVEDKSKADTIAKAFVCLQAGWFFIQGMARLFQHLPLTLLEVHTLTHIACAFGMYILWMKKPYDVGCAFACKDEAVVDMAAFFALHAERVSNTPLNF
ncbi:hypothetical protein BJ546DRAFT_846997 [Cryomyces antarcticus]